MRSQIEEGRIGRSRQNPIRAIQTMYVSGFDILDLIFHWESFLIIFLVFAFIMAAPVLFFRDVLGFSLALSCFFTACLFGSIIAGITVIGIKISKKRNKEYARNLLIHEEVMKRERMKEWEDFQSDLKREKELKDRLEAESRSRQPKIWEWGSPRPEDQDDRDIGN